MPSLLSSGGPGTPELVLGACPPSRPSRCCCHSPGITCAIAAPLPARQPRYHPFTPTEGARRLVGSMRPLPLQACRRQLQQQAGVGLVAGLPVAPRSPWRPLRGSRCRGESVGPLKRREEARQLGGGRRGGGRGPAVGRGAGVGPTHRGLWMVVRQLLEAAKGRESLGMERRRLWPCEGRMGVLGRRPLKV